MKTHWNLQRFRGLLRISLLMIALAILCRFGLHFDFAPISLAAVSSSGTPLSEPADEHGSPVSLILISLVVILISAKFGGALMERVRQPAVLGELIFGVLLGNLSLLGLHHLDYMKTNEGVGILAELGVIFLLFEVGLECNIKQMMEVGSHPSWWPSWVSSSRCFSAGEWAPGFCLSPARWCMCSLEPRSVLPASALRHAC